jgi:hypothetical protein
MLLRIAKILNLKTSCILCLDEFNTLDTRLKSDFDTHIAMRIIRRIRGLHAFCLLSSLKDIFAFEMGILLYYHFPHLVYII